MLNSISYCREPSEIRHRAAIEDQPSRAASTERGGVAARSRHEAEEDRTENHGK